MSGPVHRIAPSPSVGFQERPPDLVDVERHFEAPRPLQRSVLANGHAF